MTLAVAARVKETTITTGTGTYNLAGASTGFQTFVAGIGTGNTCIYCATDNTNWEVGIGTITSGSPDTLARTTIIASSNAGLAVNWGSGTKDIFCSGAGSPTYDRKELGLNPGIGLTTSGSTLVANVGGGLVTDASAIISNVRVTTLTAAAVVSAGNRGQLLQFSGQFTVSTVAASSVGNGFWCMLENTGASAITLDPNAAELVNDASTVTLGPRDSGVLISTESGFRIVNRAVRRALDGAFLFGPTLASATGAGERLAIDGNGLMTNDGTVRGMLGGYTQPFLVMGTYSNHDISLRLNNTAKWRITTGGALLINGDTTAPNSEFLRVRGANTTEGTVIATFAQSNGTDAVRIANTAANGWNAGAAGMVLGANSGTSRGLNSAGTLNASGADVAEYKHKASGCGTLAAGQVCGLDAAGRITDKWSDAVQFRWKSGARGIQPALAMGDAWGSPDAICPADGQPLGARPKRGDHESDADHEAAAAAFEARYEACRAQVDRLVYCGTTYLNLAELVGAAPQPGDFIVPVQNGGDICWKAVSEAAIGFDDYKRRIGRVERLDSDGTPLVAAAI